MLQMPQEIIDAHGAQKINEGHTRPLLMLNDRPDEQAVLFKEIVYKKITVREAERIARGIAKEKVRKHELLQDPEIEEMENRLKEALGTRVHIDQKEVGGKITIDFFSKEDLSELLKVLQSGGTKENFLEKHIAENENAVVATDEASSQEGVKEEVEFLDARSKEEKQKSEQEADLYNISKFSL